VRSLLALAILLLAAFGFFLARAPAAYARAREGLEDLERRQGDIESLQRRLRLVSLEDVAMLAEDRDRIASIRDSWRALLLQGPVEPARPGMLARAIAEARIPSLASNTALGAAVIAQGDHSARDEQTLARLVRILGETRIAEVQTLELRTPGRWHPVEDVEGLVRTEVQLTVVSGLSEVLDCLEALVPGRGQPVLSLVSGSLRRIEPPHWGTGLGSMTGPPTRLSVTVSAVLPAGGERG